LQFDGFVSNGDHFSTKLHSDCHLVLLSEAVIDELEQQAGFADT
jgi:hypothetical protein